MTVVAFWSASGGPEAPTLALSVAAVMNRGKTTAAVVDGDFEAPAFLLPTEKTAHNIYEHAMWELPVTPRDVVNISVDGVVVPVLPVAADSLAELALRANAVWGVSFTRRKYLRRRLRRALETMEATVGANVVLLVARSGWLGFSLDMLAAADIVVVVSRPDPLSLARTDTALGEIADEMNWGKSEAVWLRRAVPVVVMADPSRPGEAGTKLKDVVARRLAPLGVAVDAPLEVPLIPDMISADPRDYARLALKPPAGGPGRAYAEAVGRLASILAR